MRNLTTEELKTVSGGFLNATAGIASTANVLSGNNTNQSAGGGLANGGNAQAVNAVTIGAVAVAVARGGRATGTGGLNISV